MKWPMHSRYTTTISPLGRIALHALACVGLTCVDNGEGSMYTLWNMLSLRWLLLQQRFGIFHLCEGVWVVSVVGTYGAISTKG